MKLRPKIETIETKQLVVLSCEMSLIENKTETLFSAFMPKRKRVTKKTNALIYEVLIYDGAYFSHFTPENTFTKGATIAVYNCNTKPQAFKSLELSRGLYAFSPLTD
ncbi:hypothetical protein ES677_10815 [Bizionia gelidisalsuginis]|uniref:Uncharacterized protein n=1 Tax=Bizionia gelidisalsuginis TaxID=291188 RepID=A0ABY3M965_9FLAO|nr:hypothetical protein [Bizionia gelidisalsuginis]TYC10800.1 hypothetical protein ES677_10815 [Bizionia gelidisalsuginis]